MTMRKIEMRPIAGEGPAIFEMVEGRRYLAVVTLPEGFAPSVSDLRRAVATVKASLPDACAGVLALPFGYAFDVYEDTETGETHGSGLTRCGCYTGGGPFHDRGAGCVP